MTRLLKIDAALTVIAATVLTVLTVRDSTANPEMSVSRLGENALAGIRGRNPGYVFVLGADWCSCANIEAGEVCACFGNAGADCVECVGSSAGSLTATVGGAAMPAGGNLTCTTLGEFTGTCGQLLCNGVNFEGACSGQYPLSKELVQNNFAKSLHFA